MQLYGVEFLESVAKQPGFSGKLVFNDAGAIFFAAHLQHREQKAPQISYEDDYAGNALAAMLSPGRIEVRYHKAFPDRHVAQIVTALLSDPRLALMRGWQATYQARPLTVIL